MRHAFFGGAVLILGVVLGATAASATILPPAGSSATPDLFLPPVSGTVIASIGGPWAGSGGFSGNYQEIVYKDPLNPFSANDLDFIFATTNTSSPALGNEIGRMTTFNFAGFSTDVGNVASNTLTSPCSNVNTVPLTSVDRSFDGSVIGFNLAPITVFPGECTQDLVVETNAVSFGPGTISIIDSQTATIAGFSPSTVPEPGTLALLGSGILGMVGTMLGRRKTGA